MDKPAEKTIEIADLEDIMQKTFEPGQTTAGSQRQRLRIKTKRHIIVKQSFPPLMLQIIYDIVKFIVRLTAHWHCGNSIDSHD